MLQIADWDKVFENALSRKIEKLPWIRMPNTHDGDSFIELMEGHPDGTAHYGCWALLVQLASKTKPRGSLARKDGTPHTAESVSRIVRANPEIMAEAIRRLLAIGWLLETEPNTSQPVSTIPVGYQCDAGQVGHSPGQKHAGEERRGEERRRDTLSERLFSDDDEKSSPAPQAAECDETPSKSDKFTARELEVARLCYEVFPRHEKPKAAEKAILKALRDPKLKELGALNGRTPEDELWMRVQEYAEFCDLNKSSLVRNGHCYIPHPASWFNAGNYLVDPKTSRSHLEAQS